MRISWWENESGGVKSKLLSLLKQKGEFGDVFRAKWRGADCVVKNIKDINKYRAVEGFWDEIEIMR